MPWGSTAPAALTALLAVFGAAPALDATDIRDGQKTGSSGATEAVLVGWNGDPGDTLAVEGSLAMEGDGSRDREQYVIRCAVLVLKGSGDMTAARARAYELLGACGQALAASRTLGGAVLHAMVASHALSQDPVLGGGRAAIEFGVACDAYTTT